MSRQRFSSVANHPVARLLSVVRASVVRIAPARRPAINWRNLEELETRALYTATMLFHPDNVVYAPASPSASVAGNGTASPNSGSSTPQGFTATQIRHAYGFDNINFGGTTGDGTGQTIAIVDAFNNPNVTTDLQTFDATFGLSNPTLTIVNQTGGSTLPSNDTTGTWSIEIELDVQWAHVVAPKASILLVLANTASSTDLYTAVDQARNTTGVSVVSMSFGSSEISAETSFDSHFVTPASHTGVTFLASTGDSGAGVEYPSSSPGVVAVGGTSLTTSDSSGTYSSESAWSGSGGGISPFESKPTYQSSVTQSGTNRTVPDVAALANPNTGVAVVDSFDNSVASPWIQVGGTSLACPLWAGFTAIVDQGSILAGHSNLDGQSQTLPRIYATSASNLHDITTGSSSGSPGNAAATGYDLVTGLGTPVAPSLAQSLSLFSNVSTSTSMTASANPSVFGQPITFSSTVTQLSGSNRPTGTIAFVEGSITLTTAPLISGVTTYTTTNLAVGTHNLSAVYFPGGGFKASTSSIYVFVVNRASTSTTVNGSAPAVFGQSISLSASVAVLSPGAAFPSGIVAFLDGTATVGTGSVSTGVAFATIPSLGLGIHTITANYLGDADTATSTDSVGQILNVNKALTTTTVQSLTNTVFGQTATLTASIAVQSPGAGSPSGSVNFIDGTTTLGSATLASGSATFFTIALAAGTHTIKAAYVGDVDFSGSTDTTGKRITISQASSATRVLAFTGTTIVGQSVVLSASVSANAPSVGTPSGPVVFTDGTSTLGTGTLSLGVGTFTVALGLSLGTHTIKATYAGDLNFTGSADATGQALVITKASSATAVQALSSVTFGQSVTLAASVSPVSPATGNPTGVLEFDVDSVSVGTASLTAGVGSFTYTSLLTVGTHVVTSIYLGDPSFGGSTDATGQILTVNKASSSTVVASTTPVVFGQSIVLAASVTAGNPSAGQIGSGLVTFLDGTSTLGSSAVSAGVATFAATGFAVGSHTITALYGGSPSFLGSSDLTGQIQVVNAGSSSVTVIATTPVVFGQSLSLSASVAPVSPAAGAPSGIVTFLDGTTTLGTGSIVSGLASLTIPGLSVGTHTVTARYGGNGSFVSSSDTNGKPQIVNQAGSTVSLANLSAGVTGQSLTFAATAAASLPGNGNPSGVITFFDGSASLGTAAIVSGAATFTDSAGLLAGSHSIHVTYQGDTNFTPSTSTSSSLTIGKASTTTAVGSLASTVFGQTATFRASVVASAPGTGVPSGVVTFFSNSASLGTGTLTAGVATFSTSLLAAQSNTITASYLGNSNFLVSSDAVGKVEVVAKGSSRVALSATSGVVVGRTVTLSASVSPVSPAAGSPTGVITFLDGTTSIGTAQVLTGNLATFVTTSLAVGTHQITASYAGSSQFLTAVSSSSQVTILPLITTTTAVFASPVSSKAGQTVTLSATVSGANGSTGAPSGPVTFVDGSVTLGTGTLSGLGVATLTTTALSVGMNPIVATFPGSIGFTPSSSPTTTVLYGTNHERYVAQLYRDLLGREATVSERSTAASALDAGTSTPAQVATALTSGREYDGIVVDSFYVTYLGRHSDAAGLTAWVNQMQAGLNAEVIRAGILGSDEFFNRTGPNHVNGTDATFITTLYVDFLGRSPDAGGLAAWEGALAGNPANRQTVASGISNSDENRTVIITGFYQTYMHRAPDAGGLAAWKTLLANGISQPQIISAFVTSPEYFARYQIV